MRELGPSGLAMRPSEAAYHPSGLRLEGSPLSMRQEPPSLGNAGIRCLPLAPLLWGPWVTDKASRGNRAASCCTMGGGSLSQQLPQAPHPPRGQTQESLNWEDPGEC